MATESTGAGLWSLGNDIAGDVVLPSDDAWDEARQAWNLAVEQRPVAVVLPESAEDIVATVKFAAGNGLRIAFNGGGHNAGPIDWSEDALLLKTERMTGIEIDPEARRARVEAASSAGRWPRQRASTVSLPLRHVAQRRRHRLHARRRLQPDDSEVWSGREQRARGRARGGRRATRPC